MKFVLERDSLESRRETYIDLAQLAARKCITIPWKSTILPTLTQWSHITYGLMKHIIISKREVPSVLWKTKKEHSDSGDIKRV